MVKKYRNVNGVWDAIENGEIVYWNSPRFVVEVEKTSFDYLNNLTRRGNKYLLIKSLDKQIYMAVREKDIENLYSIIQ